MARTNADRREQELFSGGHCPEFSFCVDQAGAVEWLETIESLNQMALASTNMEMIYD